MCPPGGSGGVGGDAGRLQGGGVGRPQMPRDVGQHDAVAGRGPIKIVARGVAALGQQRVVVAAPEHHPAGGNAALGDPRPDLAHETVDAGHVAHRRRVQRQGVEPAPHREEMAVGVDEAGQQRAAAQIDDARLFPAPRQDRIARPRRGDDAVPHRHRLDGGLIRVHGDDVIAGEYRVGGLGGGERGNARRKAGGGNGGSYRVRHLDLPCAPHGQSKTKSLRSTRPTPTRVDAPRVIRRFSLISTRSRRGSKTAVSAAAVRACLSETPPADRRSSYVFDSMTDIDVSLARTAIAAGPWGPVAARGGSPLRSAGHATALFQGAGEAPRLRYCTLLPCHPGRNGHPSARRRLAGPGKAAFTAGCSAGLDAT